MACKPDSGPTEAELEKLISDKNEEGAAQLAAGKEDFAERSFQWVLDKQPDDPRANAGMARVLIDRQDFAAAETFARKALAKAPDDDKAHGTLGTIYAKTDRHAEAAATFAKAWELAPDDARHGLAQGQALNAAKQYADAEVVLTKVSEDDPEIQYVWTDLGDALRGQDKTKDALRKYMKAQNTHQSDKGAYAGAAFVYESQGDVSKALNQWSAYIQRDCCSTYSNDVAKPKLEELKAKENAPGAEDAPKPAEGDTAD